MQVVDVVEVHILQEIDFRLDVARHRDVDEQQRLVPAELHQRLQFDPVENVVRRGGAADDNVDFFEFLPPFVKMDGAAVQFPRQSLRPIPVADLGKGVVEKPEGDALGAELVGQPGMSVAIELQPERHPGGHAQVAEPELGVDEVEIVVQALGFPAPQVRAALPSVTGGLV